MNRILLLVIFVVFVSPPLLRSQNSNTPSSNTSSVPEPYENPPLSPENIEKTLEGPMDSSDIAAASSWIQSTGVVDWLGPLAPVALSPFFGITCLSALSLWGPDWATDNAVLGSAGPLQNEGLFVVFLILTLLTSLPRLTKVSKPFAQAVDRLETYAVIVILLVIKVAMSMESADVEMEPQVAMVHFGIVSVTLDTFLAIAMIVNVLVINSVKFFFEFLVWLTPVPFLDAIFEICNKSVCAALMLVYAWSPTVATIINLVLLLSAALILRWISRRVRFYRTMVLDPVLARLWTGFGTPMSPELIVFPKSDLGPFKAKSRLRLTAIEGEPGGWKLEEANWWMPKKQHVMEALCKPKLRRGWVMHRIELQDGSSVAVLSFSRRYNDETIGQLMRQLGIESDQSVETEKESPRAVEFA